MEDKDNNNVKEELLPKKYPRQVFTAEQLEKRRIDAKRRRDKSEKKYECPHCDMKFLFPNVLKRHSKTHEKARFKCTYCEEAFDSHHVLRSHNKEKHKKMHKCSKCPYSSSVLATVQKHFTAHHVNGVPCTVTGCTIMVAKSSLRAHLKECHPEMETDRDLLRKKVTLEVPCAQCDFKCKTQEEMDLHVERSHIGFRCPIEGCSRTVFSQNVAEHLSHAHPDHNFENEAKRVEETATDSNCVSPASDCYSIVGGSSSLHMDDTVRDVDDLELPEEISDDNSLEEQDDDLQQHIRSALGEYICSQCEMKFATSRNLTKHMNRIHFNMKEKKTRNSYKCSYEGCEKLFSAPSSAHDHLNFHLNISPYFCDHCEVTFQARARLAVHLRKYHNCSIRDYTSLQRSLPQMKLNA